MVRISEKEWENIDFRKRNTDSSRRRSMRLTRCSKMQTTGITAT